MITADKKSIFGEAKLVTFSHDLTRHKRSEILFLNITKDKKGYLACSPKHFDLEMSLQKANCAQCPPYLRFRLWFALQSIQRADLGLAPIIWGHTISQEKYLTCACILAFLLEKFRTKLLWMQAHDFLMATAFSLISFQSFLLWRDKGKDYDQDEVILRQLRSACSKTTRQLMGIFTFYLDSTTLSLYIYFYLVFLTEILFD